MQTAALSHCTLYLPFNSVITVFIIVTIIIIVIIIIINEYPEAGLTASISVQHIYYDHELQQELY